MSLPTVPRDLVALAANSLSVTVQYEPEPHEHDGRTGRTVTHVLWSINSYGPERFALACSLYEGSAPVAHHVDPVPEWVPRPPAEWLTLVGQMARSVGLDTPESVTEAVAQADADHRIAELARAWHAPHAQYRTETEGHLRAAAWARSNRAIVALVAALDAEVES